MAKFEEDITRVLTQARDEMRANMEAQDVNASGRTSASLRVEVYDKGVRLVGGTNGQHKIEDYPTIKGTLMQGDTAPIPTLEVGRIGGAVPRGFYYILRQWSREKGISFASERERSTFAYFLARKIAREGTMRAQFPANVYSEPVNKAKRTITEMLQADVSRTVSAAFRGLQTTNIKGAFTD